MRPPSAPPVTSSSWLARSPVVLVTVSVTPWVASLTAVSGRAWPAWSGWSRGVRDRRRPGSGPAGVDGSWVGRTCRGRAPRGPDARQVLAGDRRALERQLVGVQAGEQVGGRAREQEVGHGGDPTRAGRAGAADLEVEVGQGAAGREQLVAGAVGQLGLEVVEALDARRGEVARGLGVGVGPRHVVGREQAAHAVAGLAGEGVERVGDQLVASGVACGERLELGEAGVGLREEGAAARGVVVGEADLRRLDAALDAVERLAGQGGLGGDGHRGGGADQRGAAEQRGDAAVAPAGRDGHRQALRERAGCGSRTVSASAIRLSRSDATNSGRGATSGSDAQVGDDLEQGGEPLRITLGERGVGASGEERLELVGTPACRECGCHR